jgi:hypothetical protein
MAEVKTDADGLPQMFHFQLTRTINPPELFITPIVTLGTAGETRRITGVMADIIWNLVRNEYLRS